MSKLKTVVCQFCSKPNTFKQGLNFVCSCGATYYAKSDRWIRHVESSDDVAATLEKMRVESAEIIEAFHRKMEDQNS